MGGHSGVDIHKGRANALICVSRLLQELNHARIEYQLASFCGGQARNAIPASAEAKILVCPEALDHVYRLLESYSAELTAGFGEIEQSMVFRWAPLEEKISHVVPSADANALLDLLLTLPDGIHTMRPVQAAGRWYAVMAAEYTGEVLAPTFAECLFGSTE